MSLVVIIPVGREEDAWQTLLADLSQQLPAETPILFSAVEGEPAAFGPAVAACGLLAARWIVTRPGRAAQQNDAAAFAGEIIGAGDAAVLWFLHADTRLPPGAFAEVTRSVTAKPQGLHYFRLRFYDGPRRLRLTEIGVALRCRLFGIPFGDQGFCLRRSLFLKLGGFDESAAYGEDHLLVWTAKRAGVPLVRVPATLATSGRKYARHGWTRTTLRHVWLTLKQAVLQR